MQAYAMTVLLFQIMVFLADPERYSEARVGIFRGLPCIPKDFKIQKKHSPLQSTLPSKKESSTTGEAHQYQPVSEVSDIHRRYL